MSVCPVHITWVCQKQESQKLHICIKFLVHYDTQDYKKGLSNKVALFTGITTEFQFMANFPKLVFQVLNWALAISHGRVQHKPQPNKKLRCILSHGHVQHKPQPKKKLRCIKSCNNFSSHYLSPGMWIS